MSIITLPFSIIIGLTIGVITAINIIVISIASVFKPMTACTLT
jgi:F0F1-type ATP synthase assembly protein I